MQKYTPGQRAVSGSRSEEDWAYPELYFADSADDTLIALLDVAKRAGCTPAAAAIQWALAQPAITSAIVGARDCSQLEANLSSSDLRLDREDLQFLDTTSAPQPRYPKAMEEEMGWRRDSAVGK